MVGKNKLILHCGIMAISTLTLFAALTSQAPAQALAASTPVNPDRIASNYPIRYSPATIESIACSHNSAF
jgi:hypothetical protein